MIFDGHSDLLYDVTRRRLAGETCVLERRHRQKLRKGRIGGLGLSLWVTAEPDSFWAAYPGWDGCVPPLPARLAARHRAALSAWRLRMLFSLSVRPVFFSVPAVVAFYGLSCPLRVAFRCRPRSF